MAYVSPVYKVVAVPVEKIEPNAYNPNSVAPPEMKLLYESIKEDGYTMPIVCYYVKEGPAEIKGDKLVLTKIPPRAKFPVKVTVVAWQYGRSGEPQVQTAEAVEQSFYIAAR